MRAEAQRLLDEDAQNLALLRGQVAGAIQISESRFQHGIATPTDFTYDIAKGETVIRRGDREYVVKVEQR